MTDPAPTSILMPPPEPRRTRLLGLLLALALAGGFLLAAVAFDPPAHGGVDENGYLTGGKLLARHGTMAFRPADLNGDFDPFQFVGRMWVAADAGTDRETYYPKYPAGFPLLVAAALKLGGAGAVYLVNPVAAALAVLGTFFLGRHLGGTLPGLLAAVCFATSLTTIQCATDPNSHATAACCGVWGLYWLLLWLRGGGTAVAFAAGLAFGYAATIRYTEGLLILPLLWVAVVRGGAFRGTGVPPASAASPSGPVAEGNPGGTPVPRDGRPRGTGVPPASSALPSGPVAEGNPGWKPVPRGWRSALFALLGWAIPVAALAAFNLATMGHLTGYANGGESADFRLTFFASNWDVVLRQLSVGGLFLVFPIGLAGLGAMFWWDWRTAGALALAVVPCLLTYASYYWAPVGAFDDVRYLRFFLGTLPAVSAAGFWWVRRGREWAGGPGRRLEPGESRWVCIIAVAAGVLFTVLVLRYGRDQKLSPDGYAAIHFVHDAKLALARPLRQWPALLTFAAAVLTAFAAAAAVGAAAFAGRGAAAVLVGGGAAFLAVAVGAQGGTEALRPDQAERLAKAEASGIILEKVPRGAVVFCDERSLLQHLQFAGDFTLYGLEAFDARTYDGYAKELRILADAPQADDPLRRAAAVGRLGKWDQKRLDARARQIIADALRCGRPVYFVNTLTARTYAAAARDWRSPALPKWFAAFADPKQFRTERVAAWTVSDVMPAPDRHEPKSRRGWADPWPAVLRGDSGGRIYAVGLKRVVGTG